MTGRSASEEHDEHLRDPRPLPLPPPPDPDPRTAVAWVEEQLGDLLDPTSRTGDPASGRFRGGQAAADAALAQLHLTGYARRRNEVLPRHERGATALSPYVRHGLLDLPTLWSAASAAPPEDRDRFRDELLWQEYARHLYARLGSRMSEPLRHAAVEPAASGHEGDPWEDARATGMACISEVLDELGRDGWMVNQARMWVASHWSVRGRVDWRSGEDRLYRELIDGSRAANRLGWQWTAGAATGRPYAFSRSQVERRAPELCERCPRSRDCPIEDWPADPVLTPSPDEPRLRHDPDPGATAGPDRVEAVADMTPDAVWITAESLGDRDPALEANPDLPAVFVFDVPLLKRLQLHPRRLVFLAETLGDLAIRRPLEVWRGDVVQTLGPGGPAHRALTATFSPVPGWRRRAAALPVVERHPWRWLRRPDGGRVTSFSAWRERKPRR